MTGSSASPAAPGRAGPLRAGLFLKLMGAFVVVLLAMALLSTWLARRATEAEFMLFTTALGERQAELLAPLLADYYRLNGSWEGVEQVLAGDALVGGPGGMMGPGMMRPGGEMMHSGGMWEMMGLRALVVDPSGRVVADSGEDAANSIRGEQLANADLAGGAPIVVGNTRIGTALVTSLEQTAGQSERFLQEVDRAIFLSVLAGSALALLLSGIIAWRLTHPLRRLTAAAEAIAAGDLEQQVDVRPGDEIGDLATTFNQMAARLARAEALRRQLTADVAHELRTPLTVIQGNVEALQDGIFPLTPEALAPIHAKSSLLIRLVEDLRQLALAETDALPLERAPLDVVPMVREVVAEFQASAQEKGISLEIAAPPALPPVAADRERLVQVAGNLVNNALQYTPAGGTIAVQVDRAPQLTEIPPPVATNALGLVVRDSGPGIPPADLPNIFERFYRADKGRGREADGGGSGLGLAIARSLVEAHGGSIGAGNAPEGGAVFWVTLPFAEEEDAA